MSVTRYQFDRAINAFFEMDRDRAKACLPSHLEPMEVKHGLGVFAVTAFNFTDSEVGPYQEIVFAVITPPVVTPDGHWPRSAFYPFVVGTSTEAARTHAIERWHLPHYMSDIHVDFEENAGKVSVRVHEDNRPILDFAISAYKWSQVDHLYQAFTSDSSGDYRADITMHGEFTEHEEESGEITIHPHAMTEQIIHADVQSWPFREMWMRNGVQSFDPLHRM